MIACSIALLNSESAGSMRSRGSTWRRVMCSPISANAQSTITIPGPVTAIGRSKTDSSIGRSAIGASGLHSRFFSNQFGRFGHRGGPAGRRDFGAFDFVVHAREFAGIEPDAAANRALVDLHLFQIGKPFAVEDLIR